MTVTFLSTYPPTSCGIATFTKDLYDQLFVEITQRNVVAVLAGSRIAHPPEVRYVISRDDNLSYLQAAERLPSLGTDILCVQHEYGIFGGAAGSFVLNLLRRVSIPVVTTLHTVLRFPDPTQRQVLGELIELSSRVVVPTRYAMSFLNLLYGGCSKKTVLIPHGTPDLPFVSPETAKPQLGFESQMVLVTTGLLSPNKGIETAIGALPKIVPDCPEVVYVVAGITHPNVKRKDGESYRQSLQRLAEQLGVASRVIFWDRYLQQEELSALVAAADIYLSPHVNVEQTASGTLAYALGAGKVIVSTPFWYAREMLRDGGGVLVPFADSDALAERVVELIKNRDQRTQLSRKAYDLGRSMVWGKVAQTYAKTFETALRTAGTAKSTCFPTTRSHKAAEQLPPLKLNHLLRLSDSTGIIQHAVFTVPNRAEGYSTDDNARALIVAIWLEKEKRVFARCLASKYLAFLWHAFNSETGRMRNFLSYDRRWLESIGSEECHARSLWALGLLINHSGDPGLSGVASQLFLRALPSAWDFASLRAIAFALLGISDWSASRSSWSELRENGELLAERLLESYLSNSSSHWPWFEDRLTYFNARLPHALLRVGHLTGRQEMVEVALRSLQWLVSLQVSEAGQFSPIGNKGFYPRGSEKARFDQQPIEAHSMISACLEAYRVTGEKTWYDEAHRAFRWFLGSNDLGLSLYDRVTGGCRDGLHEDSASQNQGAESTLSFLMALLEMRSLQESERPEDLSSLPSKQHL